MTSRAEERNPEFSYAPWTDEEVKSLNDYQQSGVFHEFTGDVDKKTGHPTMLIATKDGWIEREGGPIYQTWAYKRMANDAWRSSYERIQERLGRFMKQDDEHDGSNQTQSQ